jgi:hypothetical protein
MKRISERELNKLAKWLKSKEGRKKIRESQKTVDQTRKLIDQMNDIDHKILTDHFIK